MKSGGPWNLRGLRPETRAAARNAARRSGMSVGEWLNTVIEPDGKADEEARWSTDFDREPDERFDERGRNAYSEGDFGEPERHGPRYADEPPRRDREPPPRGRESERGWNRGQNVHDDDAERRNGQADWRPRRGAEHRDNDEGFSGRASGRYRDQPAEGDQYWEERQHAEWERTQQERVERRRQEARERAEQERAERRRREEQERSEQEQAERERREEQQRAAHERAERQRRERERFEQAAASAAAKQHRDESINKAVAEITARQQALDGDVAADFAAPPLTGNDESVAAPPLSGAPPAPPSAPAREAERVFAAWPGGWRAPSASEPTVDIGGLQEQLRQMTVRIEALRPSSEIEKAIAGLRGDLADIGRSFTEAMPRRALESLEIEVKALGQRIDYSRQSGVDAATLAGVERGLAEVNAALSRLTPAEGLVGFDEAVRALGKKVDAVVGKDDPGALHQVEAAIDSLRGIVSHVASNETLAKVADDVRALSAKVDTLAASGPSAPTLAALENRIDILASALNASTEAGHAVPRELENLLASLIEKVEHPQLSQTDHAALAHLEDRITALVKRLDASDARLGLLEGVERGLADLLVYIDQVREAAAGAKPAAAAAVEDASAEISASEQRTQSPLTVGLGDVQRVMRPAADYPPPVESERRSDRPKTMSAEPAPLAGPTSAPPLPAHDIEEIDTHAAIDPVAFEPAGRSALAESAAAKSSSARSPIDPNLPPDHPLEPGLAARSRTGSTATERIAASEAAAGLKPPVIADPGSGKPDFIAAARRAAQAAAAATPEGKRLARPGVEPAAQPKTLSNRLRMLAVAAAVVAIVVGGFHMISRLLDDGSSGTSSPPRVEQPRGDAPQAEPQAQTPTPQAQPEPPARKEPPHVEADPLPPANPTNQPTPPATDSSANSSAEPNSAPGTGTSGQQSQLNGTLGNGALGNGALGSTTTAVAPHSGDRKVGNRAPATAGAPLDITGVLPSAPAPNAQSPNAAPAPGASAPHSTPTSPASERLPAAIGGPNLRLAALAGDPLAAYEVGVRFADGRLVPVNNEEAAHWLEIAAKHGIVPAQFRLGTLYEKGLGVKKDLATAGDLYRAAADKGHGKAMHNLAVLYAEGGDGKPDYNNAALWFRKAADHGVTDSQYNLAILYARGVGVEQNLAEAYKWFFLAANEGDQDSAQKRDQIGSRLDPQTLAAARAAAESWKAVPQPADAIGVKGVWDPPAGAAPPAKPKPRSAKAPAADVARVN